MKTQIRYANVCILLCLVFMTACRSLSNDGGTDWATVQFSIDGSKQSNAHYASSSSSIQTALIIAVPASVTTIGITEYLSTYYDSQLQDITNNRVKLRIPLNTSIRLAKVAFEELCTLDEICSTQPTAFCTGMSEAFSVNGDEESKSVAITMDASYNSNAITSFSFTAAANTALSSDVTATISGTNITIDLPVETNVTALVASFTTNGTLVKVGSTVQVSGMTANDFSGGVAFTVTAIGGSTFIFTVAVNSVYTTFSVASNPSAGGDFPQGGLCLDDDYIYISGRDYLPGNAQIRIEKRMRVTGALVSSFEDSTVTDGVYTPIPEPGVVQSNEWTINDFPRGMAVDNDYIYVTGRNQHATGSQWRTEKRDKTTGALDTAFNGTGYIHLDLNAIDHEDAADVVLTTNEVFVIGDHRIPGGGDAAWQVHKYFKNDGSYVTAFDTDGWFEMDTGAPLTDKVNGGTVDTTSLYLAGYDQALAVGNGQWRIEKRNVITGAYDGIFGGGTGIIQQDIAAGNDIPQNIRVDSTHMFIAGGDLGPGDEQWRLEKRDIITGNLDVGFDGDGIVTVNHSPSTETISAMELDSDHVYIAGNDYSSGAVMLRVEKRSKSDGSLDTNFGTSGVLTVSYSGAASSINLSSFAVDQYYFYIAFTDDSPGDLQWRIEKRRKDTGGF